MQGTTVTLYNKVQTGTDAFNHPVYEEAGETVEDVLIGEPSTDDITSSTALYGKQITYMLGIPKGDTHDWMDKRISWEDEYGVHNARTFGIPITGIEANIPGRWHKKVRCEAYG